MNDFLRTNFPYGIKKNNEGEWMIFNRLYLPLGMTRKDEAYFRENEKKFYFRYKGITEKLLEELGKGQNITHDSDGKIISTFSQPLVPKAPMKNLVGKPDNIKDKHGGNRLQCVLPSIALSLLFTTNTCTTILLFSI